MSSRLVGWARDQRTGDPHANHILLLLADNADADGACWPSHRLLAADSEMDERTVRRKIDVLVTCKLLEKESRLRANGGKTSNLYWLLAGGALQASDRRDGLSHPSGTVPDTPPGSVPDPSGQRARTHRADRPMQCEPSREPSLEKGKGDLSIAREGGSAIWRGPPEILHELARRRGQEFAVGYLTRCGWDADAGQIIAPNGVAADKLKSAISAADWAAIGVRLIEKGERV